MIASLYQFKYHRKTAPIRKCPSLLHKCSVICHIGREELNAQEIFLQTQTFSSSWPLSFSYVMLLERPETPFGLKALMIRLDNVSKQVGHQILFIEASAALLKGEKIGLVGPNGAGKTTLFRMISGEELPDQGQVMVDRGMSIGYFSQDVGEMSGHSAVAEVMNGAGPVSAVASELKELETAMADPDRADDMDEIIARYGEVQGRFEELDGYALDGRAREALAGLGFSQEMMDGDVGALSGGWKMRVALARILLMRPDVMLLDEPSNHLDLESLIWLEQFLKATKARFDDLA